MLKKIYARILVSVCVCVYVDRSFGHCLVTWLLWCSKFLFYSMMMIIIMMENKEGRNFQLSSLFVDLYRNEILFSFTFISVLVPVIFISDFCQTQVQKHYYIIMTGLMQEKIISFFLHFIIIIIIISHGLWIYIIIVDSKGNEE